MKKFVNSVVPAVLLLATPSVFAAAGAGNCRTQAVSFSVKPTAQAFKTQRAWDESTQEMPDGSGGLITVNGMWVDFGDASTPVEDQIGCYWLKVNLAVGKDYVIYGVLPEELFFDCERAEEGTYTKLNQTVSGGTNFLYVCADGWSPVETATTVSYYIQVYGGRGTVGKSFSLNFREQSIDELVEAQDGTFKRPRGIEVSKDGHDDIGFEPAEQPAETVGRAVVYSANLKAGLKYVFTGTHPSSAIGAVVSTPEENEGFDRRAVPGEIVYEPQYGRLTISVTNDYAFTFYALFYPKSGGGVNSYAGGRLAWTSTPIVPPKPPEPISSAAYDGKLTDVECSRVQAAFKVDATLMDTGSAVYSVTVAVENVEFVFSDNELGEVVNVREVGGKVYRSFVSLQPTDDGKLHVDGSIYFADGDEGMKEFFFGGDIPLQGEGPDPDLFTSYDPENDSAAKMGITVDAFKNETAGSDELKKLWEWGKNNEIKISEVNDGMSFASTGDPSGLMAAAYLLNCAPDASEVETATEGFVITAFDPIARVVTIADGKKDGDGYGNGKIEIRTSVTVDGTYDRSAKTGARLFYRAYLVK